MEIGTELRAPSPSLTCPGHCGTWGTNHQTRSLACICPLHIKFIKGTGIERNYQHNTHTHREHNEHPTHSWKTKKPSLAAAIPSAQRAQGRRTWTQGMHVTNASISGLVTSPSKRKVSVPEGLRYKRQRKPENYSWPWKMILKALVQPGTTQDFQSWLLRLWRQPWVWWKGKRNSVSSTYLFSPHLLQRRNSLHFAWRWFVKSSSMQELTEPMLSYILG